MLVAVLLEGEPQSGAIWYDIFRQSPKRERGANVQRLKSNIRRPRWNARPSSRERDRRGTLTTNPEPDRRPRDSAMSEEDVSLPTNRAFVIQLQASSGASEVGHRGRVEHLASGRAMRFADEAELWAFVDRVLATKCSERSEPAG